ncbi:MAG: prepilin-type N-terminal cleavage/methylation domain-containing protein [bacterium]
MSLKKLFKKIGNKIGFTQHLLFLKKKEGAGFTLIETMVAITVLLTAVVGPMEIASKSLFSSFYARDQITAYYLAQEGIEYLRNYRDNYYLPASAPLDWPPEFQNCAVVTDLNIGCKVDLSDTAITNKTVITKCDLNCGELNYDNLTGLYSYNPGNASKYSRVVTMETAKNLDGTDNRDAVLVSSTISWKGSYLSGATKSFTIKEVLYNWQTK